jgi:hypothetical protein
VSENILVGCLSARRATQQQAAVTVFEEPPATHSYLAMRLTHKLDRVHTGSFRTLWTNTRITKDILHYYFTSFVELANAHIFISKQLRLVSANVYEIQTKQTPWL